ncbi:MAG: hypothetical protein ACUZ8H_01585 [Candidatus Anammoxibacter sp.]
MLAINGKNIHGKDTFEVIADIPHSDAMGDQDETPICAIYQFNSHEEAKADTKLIAASKDLLEALQDLVQWCIENNIHKQGNRNPKISIAQKAINKAL